MSATRKMCVAPDGSRHDVSVVRADLQWAVLLRKPDGTWLLWDKSATEAKARKSAGIARLNNGTRAVVPLVEVKP